jgi:biopolymer transport protein ExbD
VKLPRHERPRAARIVMLPLMDVMFLVLVVFIYSTLSMVVHRGVPLRLPGAAAASVSQEEYLVVSLTEDGELFLNRDAVSIEELPKRLLALDDGERCYLAADRAVPHGEVVRVLDVLRLCGIEHVALEAVAPAPR